jgi:hypothetical protein
MPAEITLTNGVVLRKVSVVRWRDDYVMLRHIDGIDPVRYENIADPKPDVIRAIKAAAMALAKSNQSKQALMQSRVISGQVFVTTEDAGIYKFRGVKVVAYPADIYDEALDAEIGHLMLGNVRPRAFEHTQAWIKTLRDYAQIASSETDADGRFFLAIPPQTSVFLVCYTDRQVGYNREFDLWIVQAGETDHLDLNDANQWVRR